MKLLNFLFRRTNVLSIISEQTNYNIKELICLSPDGKEHCPQGVYLAKGKWHQMVRINEANFTTKNQGYVLEEGGLDEQDNLDKNKGGFIIFPTDVNAVNDISESLDKVKLLNIIFKYNNENIYDYFVAAFSVGNFFHGRYVDNNDKIYNKKSTSIKINGVPSKGLLLLSIEIANEFKQETALIKDVNENKFYLAERKR